MLMICLRRNLWTFTVTAVSYIYKNIRENAAAISVIFYTDYFDTSIKAGGNEYTSKSVYYI